jgi:SSS family solute:Na+ symporter
MLSRLFCSRDESGARRGIALSIAVILPIAFLIALLGMLARAPYPGSSPEAALPLLMKGTLPPLLSALAVLALAGKLLGRDELLAARRAE